VIVATTRPGLTVNDVNLSTMTDRGHELRPTMPTSVSVSQTLSFKASLHSRCAMRSECQRATDSSSEYFHLPRNATHRAAHVKTPLNN